MFVPTYQTRVSEETVSVSPLLAATSKAFRGFAGKLKLCQTRPTKILFARVIDQWVHVQKVCWFLIEWQQNKQRVCSSDVKKHATAKTRSCDAKVIERVIFFIPQFWDH